MHRILVVFAIICLIVGGTYSFSVPEYGIPMAIAGVLLYILYSIFGSDIMGIFRTYNVWKEYTTPSQVYEAACLLEDHKNGRNTDQGGDVAISQEVWESDFVINANARTLLESNDPGIVVTDERTDPKPMTWLT